MESNCITLTRYFYSPIERPETELKSQLNEAESIVGALVTSKLLPYQQEALICLVSDLVSGFSESSSPFHQSFLVKALNRGMMQVAAGEFCMFCYDRQGRIPTRNWDKRRAEQYLFTDGKLLFD